MVSATVLCVCVWSLLAVAAAGERLRESAHHQLLDERQRDGAMMHGRRAPVNVSQLSPCSYITNPADLFVCRTAGVIELKDCSKIDENTIIAAPYLTTVTALRLECDALALYLPRLATVTGTFPGERVSIDLQAWVQYVYLFSLNAVAAFANFALHPQPEIFEAPYLQHTNGVNLLLSRNTISFTRSSASPIPTVALHGNELCGADKTLTSAQVLALEQSCAVGNVNWDSSDGVAWTVLADAAGDCAATSIRSARFSNVPRSDGIPALNCLHVDYVGDSSTANPGLALTFKNAVLQMDLSHSTAVYGGIYMVESSIRLALRSAVTMHGARSYLHEPGANPIIPVPDPYSSYQRMVRCRLTMAGQFVPFSDWTLANCG